MAGPFEFNLIKKKEKKMQLKLFLIIVQCLFKIATSADIHVGSSSSGSSQENSFLGTAQLISIPRQNRANRDFPNILPTAVANLPPVIQEYNDLLNVDTRNFTENQKNLFNRIIERVAILGTNAQMPISDSDLKSDINDIEAGRSNKKYSHNRLTTPSSPSLPSSSSSLNLNSNRPTTKTISPSSSQLIPVPIKIKTKQNLHDNNNNHFHKHNHHSHNNNSVGNNNSVNNGKLKDIPSLTSSTRIYQNKTILGTNSGINNNKKKQKIFVNNNINYTSVSNNVGINNNRLSTNNVNIDQKVLFGNISTVSIVDSLSQNVKNGVTNKDLYIRERPSTTSLNTNNTKKFNKVNV